VGLALLVAAATRVGSRDEALYRGPVHAAGVERGGRCAGSRACGPGAPDRGLALRPVVAAGVISYSLYVWHLPIFEIVGRNTRGWHPLPSVALGVTLAVLAAVASYRFVERPFRRRRAARA
jgi:peptidoglycan/LPS O-acetylase OafA/YrhL